MLDLIAPRRSARDPSMTVTPKVTTMELFFDLVYVFSIIQLSHYLLAHLSWTGAVEFITLFAAVWWAWNYTAWAANWIDPEHRSGRLLFVFLMGCALLMAVALPTAFSATAWLFVGAYVTMAVVRGAYLAIAFRGQTLGRNYTQLLSWSVLSGVLWVLGAMNEPMRLPLWIGAVLVDYAGPFAGFWLPGYGSTPMSSWPLRGLHLLERNELIVIIALGESILLLGGTLLGTSLAPSYLITAGVGFLILVSVWSLYFVCLAQRAEHAFDHAENPADLARASLAYSHGVMVCGAIIVAVAIEIIVAHPSDPVHAPQMLVVIGGPIVFLLGISAYERSLTGALPVSNLATAFSLVVVGHGLLWAHANGTTTGVALLAMLVLLNVLAPKRPLAGNVV